MRRGVGISGLQKQEAGQVLASAQFEQLKRQFALFKAGLEDFARKHRKEITKNPILRSHFQQMCSTIGVDPLASAKGFWAQVLGVGDFYYELSVQVAEACLLLRDQTGGLVDLGLIKQSINKTRGSNAVEISDDDVVRAVQVLKPLQSGFSVIKLGGRKMIQSVPRQLSQDHAKMMEAVESLNTLGQFSRQSMQSCLSWSLERIDQSINFFLTEGLAWIDDQADGGRQYWFPCFFGKLL